MAKKIICFCLLLSFVSCGPKMYRDTFVASGTFVRVVSPFSRAASLVNDEFLRLDRTFNPYRDDSEISRLNRSQGTEMKVTPELCGLLARAKEIFSLTGGYFDPSQGALYLRWKDFIKGNAAWPSEEEISRIRVSSGMDAVEVDSSSCMVKITDPKVRLDLSGIAKGFIVDRAVARLKSEGIDSALIDAGGDIYCLGKNRGRPWVVGIQDPVRKSAAARLVSLSGQAVATSGNYEQYCDYQGLRYSHLIDPGSARPVRSETLSVSVVAQDAASADAYATAFFLMGKEETKKYLATTSSPFKIYFITGDRGGLKIDEIQ